MTESPSSEIQRLRSERDLAESEVARLRRVHEDVEEDRNRLLFENTDLNKTIAKLEKELGVVRGKLAEGEKGDHSRSSGEAMKRKLEAAETELRTVMIEFGDLEKKVGTRKRELAEFLEFLENLSGGVVGMGA